MYDDNELLGKVTLKAAEALQGISGINTSQRTTFHLFRSSLHLIAISVHGIIIHLLT
jgi:hypothetical protein